MAQLSIDKFQSPVVSTSPMTINGTVIRTFTLLLFTTMAAVVGWVFLPASFILFALLLGAGGSILFSVLAGRQPLNAKLPAIGYALLQGVLVGAIARMYEASYEGIILAALAATGVTVLTTLIMYAAGLVKVTRKFRSIVLMATMAVMAFYILSIVLALFGVTIPFVFSSGPIGIAFSVLVIGIATAGLFVDYQVVSDAISQQADERFEWFAAFGITASVIWIFIEIMRLFAKIR
jgi:uncharacterized YccA/Bax inhibitor family protein